MASVTLLACQIDIPSMTTAMERDAHVQRVAQRVDQQLQQQPVDVVVLPELSSIDYSREAFSNLNELAESAQGNSFDIWRNVAVKHHCHVVFGFAQKITSGVTIATAVIDQSGECIAVYHKLHLAQFGDSMEKEYFCAGEKQLAVFEVNGFRLSPIICYDIRAPELCRTLAVEHHVDAILHTGAYARDPSFYSWHAFATTRAVENQVYFLSLNRAGDHFGDSLFCPPWIDENHQPTTFADHTEEFRRLTLHKSVLQQARSDYTFLKDRLTTYELPVVGSSQ